MSTFRYLFNLSPGEYTIEVHSYLYSQGELACHNGMEWLVRAVGDGITLHNIE